MCSVKSVLNAGDPLRDDLLAILSQLEWGGDTGSRAGTWRHKQRAAGCESSAVVRGLQDRMAVATDGPSAFWRRRECPPLENIAGLAGCWGCPSAMSCEDLLDCTIASAYDLEMGTRNMLRLERQGRASGTLCPGAEVTWCAGGVKEAEGLAPRGATLERALLHKYWQLAEFLTFSDLLQNA